MVVSPFKFTINYLVCSSTPKQDTESLLSTLLGLLILIQYSPVSSISIISNKELLPYRLYVKSFSCPL